MSRSSGERNAFTCGFGIAAAELARGHGETTLAYYLLSGACFSYADLVKAGLEEYDLAPLREVYAENGAPPAQGIETAKPPRRETGSARKGESPVRDSECAQKVVP